MRIGYGRVSTRDQNPAAQHDALAAAGCVQVYIDKASGKLASRPELDKAPMVARGGDHPEQGNQPGETVYRVQMSNPIPIHFSTMIGDVLHNLRSALDCAACEMARRTVGRDLTEQEEHACEFPIRSRPSELRKFFKHVLRTNLYGPQERQAIRAVQPAWLHDYLAESGQISAHKRSEEVAYDFLTVLNRLSNIDKHRRLHVVTCWPDLVHWGSDGPSKRRWA